MREGELPYQKWFNGQDYDTLGSFKESFFTRMKAIKLSPAFEDFRIWLEHLQYCFSDGFEFKYSYEKRMRRAGNSAGELALFDDETLGGHIDYPSLIKPIGRLRGELKGLNVHYPVSQPPTAPADAVQADA